MMLLLSALLVTGAAELAPAAAAPTLAPAVSPSALEPVPAGPAVQDEEEEELGKWHGSVGLGFTWQGGNTRRTNLSFTADAAYRREKDRTTAQMLFNKAQEDGTTTDRKLYGAVKYDYFLSEVTYLYTKASGESDRTADLDLRWILSAGIGHNFYTSETFTFDGEVGLSYVDESYEDPDDDDAYLAARLAYDWEYTPNETWNAAQIAEAFPSLEDSDDITTRLDTRGRLNLTERMFAQAQWIWTWDTSPAGGAKRSDHTVFLTLGWSF
jgi:putative salt-induced outer membrane protein YdiY